MAPLESTESQSSKCSVGASSSNSRKQEKSSIGKITKNLIKSQTAKNVLNPDSIKKVQDLLDEDIGMNSQKKWALQLFAF